MKIELLTNITTELAKVDFMGTEYKSDFLYKPQEKLSKDEIEKILKDKELDNIQALLDKIKDTKQISEANKEKLKELIEKLKKTAEKFGLKMELAMTKEGNPMVRILNRLNNRLVATIPMQVLLRELLSANLGDGQAGAGTTPQAVESVLALTDEITSAPTRTDIII